MTGKRFHTLLRDHRLNAGITQEKLADLIGESETMVVGYERGRKCPDIRSLRKIVQALGLQENPDALRELERKGLYTPMSLDIPSAETIMILDAGESTSGRRKKRK